MDFTDLLNDAKVDAIQSVLLPTEASAWRGICRSYSIMFYTPLHVVETLDPEKILQAIYEQQLDNFDPEKHTQGLYEQLCRIENPDWEEDEEEDLEDFIAKAEAKELERVKSGKAIKGLDKPNAKMPTLENTTTKEPVKSNLPISGGVNFDHLAALEQEESDF